MPKVYTYLCFRDYKRLMEKAGQQGITPYELVKEMVVFCLNDDVAKGSLSFRQKVKRFLENLDRLP